MNEQNAKLIAKMQTELDGLKELMMSGDKNTVFEKSYEYIMKREIIYAAHNNELTVEQAEALLSSPSPLCDVYNAYLKLDETALSDTMFECMKNEAQIALESNNVSKPIKKYDDAFFIDNERKCVVWMYYNPDSTAGGQYVTNIMDFDELAKISAISRSSDDYFNYYFASECKQYLADVDTEQFAAAEEAFHSKPDFVNATHNTMEALSKIVLIEAWANELKEDLPSFIKTAFAWDELCGEYGSVEDKVANGADPKETVRDFFIGELGGLHCCTGEYMDAEWSMREQDSKPVITIYIKREGDIRPFCTFDTTFSWDDITVAVMQRIEQEKMYNKVFEHGYSFAYIGKDKYIVTDKNSGQTVIRGTDDEIYKYFEKNLNSKEAANVINLKIIPALYEADKAFKEEAEEEMEI